MHRKGRSAIGALSLAIAFAISLALFSVMDNALLTPLPITSPLSIYEILFFDPHPQSDQRFEQVSYTEYKQFQDSLHSFSGVAYQRKQGVIVSNNGRRSLKGAYIVSSNYFKLLGTPVEGPGLPVDGRPGVVISHRFWDQELGHRANVIGEQISVDGVLLPVVGIAEPSFSGIGEVISIDLWIPAETWLASEPNQVTWNDQHEGIIVGRLRDNLSKSEATAEVKSVGRAIALQSYGTNSPLVGYAYQAIAEVETRNAKLAVLAVFVLVLLLAIACGNLVGILLAEAEERRRETAIRQALGASRARLILEWMLESVVISTVAEVVGAIGAAVLIMLVTTQLPRTMFPINAQFSLGYRVWIYALLLLCFSVIASSLIPAIRGSHRDLLSGLQRSGFISIIRVRVPIRTMLIVAQVAGAEILLFAGGIALPALWNLEKISPGFDPSGSVVVVSMSRENLGAKDPVNRDQIRELLASTPGVRRVAYGASIPLSGQVGMAVVAEASGQTLGRIQEDLMSPGFLSVLGIPLIAGRDLQRQDLLSVVVNEALAKQIDRSMNVLGREIRINGEAKNICGIAKDVHWTSLYDADIPRVMSLLQANSLGDTTFAIQVSDEAGSHIPILERKIEQEEPRLAILTIKTLRQNYEESFYPERILTKSLILVGIIALLLAITGLYGILASVFAQREREFAIRVALGARPWTIIQNVLRSSLFPAIAGLAFGGSVGLVGAVLLAHNTSAILINPFWAAVFSSLVVIGASGSASMHPIRRVLRINPVEIIRVE